MKQFRKIKILRKTHCQGRRGCTPGGDHPQLSPSVTEKTKAGNTNRSTMRGYPNFNQGGNMPSKNTSVISARVRDDIAVKLGEIAENRGITIAKLIEDMVEKHEEKGVTPHGYGIFEEIDTPLGIKLEKQMERLREGEYPERFIKNFEDTILNGVREQIDMLPKKFNPKRMRSDDWGC